MIDPNDRPGHLARRFQQIAVAVFHGQVEALGCDLTPVQYAALLEIAQHPDIDQATLAGAIAYDRATITGVVDRLEQKDLILRRVSDRDRRARLLRLSIAGEAMLARIEPAVEAAQRIMLSGLDDAEAAELIRLLRKAVEGANDLSRAPLRAGDGG